MRNETMLVKITPPPGPSLCYRTPRGDFPPELVREVAENLAGDFEALLTFSLLCHRWRNASRPILFTNVKIPRPQRLAEFVAIIDNDPSVAYYVRELMLGRQGNFETEWYQDIAPALGERLPNLTKLRILSLYFYTPAFEDLTAIKLETYQGLVSGFSRIETLQFTMSMLPPDILPKTLACAENLKTLIFDSCFPAGDATTEGKENEEADEAILKARSLGTSVHFGWPLVSCDHGANKASTLALHLLVEPMTSGPLKVISLTIPELQHSYWPLSTLEFIIYKHKQTLEELILEIPAPSTRTQLCKMMLQLGRPLRWTSRLRNLTFRDTPLFLIKEIVGLLDGPQLPNITIDITKKFILVINEYFPLHTCRNLDILFSEAPHKPFFVIKLAPGGLLNMVEILRARFPRLFAERRLCIKEGHQMYRIRYE